jgi:tetratricopeptide (TPR) repeat protein
MRSHTAISVLAFLLPILFSFEGCVILNPVGDAISSGYENTLTYFNVYYNASKAFNDAESSIRDAKKASELKGVQGTQDIAIPADAQKNLDLVIDKCSNILAYHSKSSYVDDALMMTGKAFYYKGEYAKAERKFLELISQYPNSSLNLEAQLWCSRSQEKLSEYDAALKTATALAGAAEQQKDGDLLSEAYYVLGSLSVHAGAIVPALESYEKSAEAADNDQLRANAWQKAGRLYFDDGQYENSINASENVLKNSDDVYQIFQSKLLIAQSYRNLERLDKALVVEDEMADDYRFKDLLGPILLERGRTLLAGGREQEAIDLFRRIDTTYGRTEAAASADYELGKYFQTTAGDYQRAREYYSKSMSVPGTPVTAESARLVNALSRYLDNVKQLRIADSLSAFAVKSDSNQTLSPDTASLAAKDSTAPAGEALRSTAKIPKKVILQDSLDVLKMRAAGNLGELFYTDLANPDSAIFWLRYALTQRYDSRNAPRMLYMLSELATTYPDKTRVTAKEFQDQLIRDFPDSYFARQLQNGPASAVVEKQDTDSAAVAYEIADSLIASHNNERAIAALDSIILRYPNSPQAAKSRYAIGWIYENRLSKMDSAAAEYKLLLVEYPMTPYAKVVSGRQLDTLAAKQAQTQPAVSDTSAVSKKDTVLTGAKTELNPKSTMTKPPGALSRRARILQSTQGKPVER